MFKFIKLFDPSVRNIKETFLRVSFLKFVAEITISINLYHHFEDNF